MRSILSNCQGREVWREGPPGVISEASKDTCAGTLEVEFAEGKSILMALMFLNYQLMLTRDLCLYPNP